MDEGNDRMKTLKHKPHPAQNSLSKLPFQLPFQAFLIIMRNIVLLAISLHTLIPFKFFTAFVGGL